MKDHASHQLVLATANPHKVDELRAILAPANLTILALSDLRAHGPFHEPEEIGHTFERNAAIKALSYAQQTGMTCLADDSGLEIDALDGRPGVISSHYFNDGRTDAPAVGMSRADRDQLNNARVLRELAGVPFAQRTARFVCVMAMARPREGGRNARSPCPNGAVMLKTFRATFEGRIGFPSPESPHPDLVVPRGPHGFGYDPLFLVAPAFTHTGAQLAPDVKNQLSHRAQAARQLLYWFEAEGLDAPDSP